ncbi:hypothetical protein [Seonamhaeicola maritimus]|uniref:Uncharacterized protein n=1 Tax=Seonamhaeicola maritimus TaxID=2591822 RepID=A0A5C7GG31_9FLAO|nr:hypothetical protein [Seonamhaeicola maritimus]TXG36616.1 hypothetical protein FUA22_08495 [Seonamhaeicola maritimus]
MQYISRLKYLFVFVMIWSCTNSDDEVLTSLVSYLQGKSIEQGGVIACAASDKTTGEILTFYYPKAGASNIKYFETENTVVDGDDYSNYTLVSLPNAPVFNGYLGKFTHASSHEKWMIVTFELEGEIKVSNPIRSKQITKESVWNDQVTIDQSQSMMPNFMWADDPVGDNAIYFQVVIDEQNNLLSGTYTYDNYFQYYNTSNVVLNVTTQNPPDLMVGSTYNFVLMDVSEDNWVNWMVEKSFQAQ